MQWPIYHEDTPILHLLDFRTDDGLGSYNYHQYKMRGMVEEILQDRLGSDDSYYLTTGRILAHYNNSAQTKRSQKLVTKYDEDIVYAPIEDEDKFGDKVILKSQYGESEALTIRYSDKIKPNTIYTTFHHASSCINALFGDESDELVMTARFKSIKVQIIPVGDEIGCS
jgi:formate dehydrogenase major subunit